MARRRARVAERKRQLAPGSSVPVPPAASAVTNPSCTGDAWGAATPSAPADACPIGTRRVAPDLGLPFPRGFRSPRRNSSLLLSAPLVCRGGRRGRRMSQGKGEGKEGKEEKEEEEEEETVQP